MKLIPEDQKQKIIKALKERGATQPCTRCGGNSFTLLDGYFVQPLAADPNSIVLGGPAVPSAVVACTKCGYLCQHALGIIGLMPKAESGDG